MKDLFRMDLQLFATDESGGGGTDAQADTEGAKAEAGDATAGKTADALTEEDVRRMIQSETDRVRTEYVQKLRAVEAERDELKKQAMSEQERAEFEAQQRAQELADKERQLKERELALFAVDQLRAKELPLEFRDFIVAGDEEATKQRLETLATLFNDAIEKAVSERFKDGGRTPNAGGGAPKDLAQQIAEAERKGDWNTARRLKLQQMAQLKQ